MLTGLEDLLQHSNPSDVIEEQQNSFIESGSEEDGDEVAELQTMAHLTARDSVHTVDHSMDVHDDLSGFIADNPDADQLDQPQTSPQQYSNDELNHLEARAQAELLEGILSVLDLGNHGHDQVQVQALTTVIKEKVQNLQYQLAEARLDSIQHVRDKRNVCFASKCLLITSPCFCTKIMIFEGFGSPHFIILAVK